MLRLALAVAVAAATLSAQSAWAQFPSRNIDFLIPFAPGGGFDRTVRMVSPFMEKTLPKKVEVLPKNLPGAGGQRAVATVYRAKPDGHTITIANFPGIAMPSLLGEKVEYDMTRFAWVARLGGEDYMLGVSAKSSIKTVDDLRKLNRPLKVLHTDFGSTAYAASAILGDALKLPMTHISGYKGTNDYIVGVIRGDGDFAVAPVSTFKQFVESGDIRPVFTAEKTSSMPGVPTIAQLGFPDLSGLAVERYVLAPPGTPAAIVKILSDAMGKAAADPQLIELARKAGEPLSFLPTEQAKAAADKSLAVYTRYKGVIGRRN